ncbi:MAG TPA: AAA family ATPase [Nannocystaceae bacterium]|nr:AAA family ATPase [Nannocystaceae bacterium]
MGAVFRVFDTATRERFALKTLQTDESGLKRQRAELWFRREFQVMAGLRHPCIVQVFDFGIERADPGAAAGAPFYTMELLDGRDLRDAGHLDVPAVCRVLRDIASALAFLHARGLVHRDLKPRNVRCTSRGRAKLLDFGILASMGVVGDIAGTPPSMAPETVHGFALDGRADLFGLGALAYWVLTGRHAYPARTVEQLEQCWRVRPPPVDEIRRDVPAPLAELVHSMLELDPNARPSSAALVIDRLDAISGVPPDPEVDVARGWLQSAALVGRDDELAQIRVEIESATRGSGGALALEGPSGLGKSRLLREAGWAGQLAGALVLRARGQAEATEPYAAVRQLVRQLFSLSPADADATSRAHVALIGRVLPTGVGSSDSWDWQQPARPVEPAEERLRMQVELLRYFTEVARRRPLVLLVDELQVCDESSAAFFAALARECETQPIALIAALRTDMPTSAVQAVAAFRDAAIRVQLTGLHEAGVAELVRALFGDLDGAERLAARLHATAGGNPMQTMELVRHFVDRGLIRYAEGMWVVSGEAIGSDAPDRLTDALSLRVAALPAEARALAEVLAIAGVRMPIEWCVATAEGASEVEVFASIDRLAYEQIIVGDDRGFEIVHDGMREALLRGMSDERRRRLHLACARTIAADAEDHPELHCRLGWHWLKGGEVERGAELLESAGRLLYDAQSFADALPPLEAALEVLRCNVDARRRCLDLQQMLMRAGVLCDRATVLRHAASAIAAMAEDSGMARAARLAPRLGAKLALATALTGALASWWTGARRTREHPRQALIRLIALVNYAASVHSLGYAADELDRLLELVAPLQALRGRVPRGAFLLTENFKWLALGHWRRVEDNVVEVLSIMDKDRRTPLGELDRRLATGAAHYMRACVRANHQDVRYRDELAVLDGIDLRFFSVAGRIAPVIFHRLRGEESLAREQMRLAETGIVQLGNAWVFESQLAWVTPIAYGVTQDVLGLKRSIDVLDRLCAEGYRFAPFAGLARGEYARARGDAAAARVLLEDAAASVPDGNVYIATVVDAALADALVDGAAWPEAVRVVDRALDRIAAVDESFPPIELRLRRARALAWSGLGRTDDAIVEVDALIEGARQLHSPIACGTMHEARALLARAQSDDVGFRDHADRMAQYFLATANEALIARASRLVGRALDTTSSRRDGGDEATVQITEDRGDTGASDTSVATDPRNPPR